jgi:hypothetical protein
MNEYKKDTFYIRIDNQDAWFYVIDTFDKPDNYIYALDIHRNFLNHDYLSIHHTALKFDLMYEDKKNIQTKQGLIDKIFSTDWFEIKVYQDPN